MEKCEWRIPVTNTHKHTCSQLVFMFFYLRIQGLTSTLQGILTRGRSSPGGVDLDQDPVLCHSLDIIKLSDAIRQEIRGHFGCFQKGNFYLVVFERLAFGFGHVAEAFQMGGDHQGQDKGGLGGRLVDTGKGSAGIQGFELCGSDNLVLAVGVFVVGSIKTRHLIVQTPDKVNFEHQSTRFGNGFRKQKGDRRLLHVDTNLVGLENGTSGAIGFGLEFDLGTLVHQFLGMQGNPLGFFLRKGFPGGHGNRNQTVKRIGDHVGNDAQIVFLWLDVRREQDAARFLVGWGRWCFFGHDRLDE